MASLKPHDRHKLQRLREQLLQEREYNAEERRQAAHEGAAMSDGSFPIYTPADLEHAIHLWSHSNHPAEAKAHIVKRAHELGISDKLPYDWSTSSQAISAGEGSDVPSDPPGRVPAERVSLREHVESIESRVVEAADGRHVVDVTLIRAGVSKNGVHYGPDVLSRAVPLFEGAVAFADHSYEDNPLKRSVRDIVGHYRHARMDAGRLRAQLHLVPGNDWLWALLQESQSNPNLCGLSIDALGNLQEGTKVVSDLTKVYSVDVVARPSAGGSFDRILASESPSPTAQHPRENDVLIKPRPITYHAPDEGAGAAATAPTQPQPQGSSLAEGQQTPPQDVGPTQHTQSTTTTTGHTDLTKLIEQLQAEREAAQRELARVNQVLNPGSAPTPDPAADLTRLAEELRRDRDLARAEQVLSSKLQEATLPPPVEAKLRKQFGGRVFEQLALEQAIADEKEVLAALTTLGQIRGMGYEKTITVGMNEYEQLQAAFDKLFDVADTDAARAVPPFSGIREAFYVATGVDITSIGGSDRPIREAFGSGLRDYVRRGRLSEAEAILREADVTNASFSALLGTSMNKRLLKDYQAWPSEWQKFTTLTAIKDFKTQTRVRLGAFGSLSTVAEDAAYTNIVLADTSATYSPTKRGNIVAVTRETIINDDLYAIKQIPQKLAVAAAFTLAEFVYNLLAPNFGNIYDSHPLFDSINHKNTGVIAANLNTANSGAALSAAALETAIINMRKQTNMASKPIGLKPRYLLVPPDLEFSAMTILRSAGLPGGNNNDINPMMGYAEPIVAPQLNALTAGPTSTSIWIAVADPRVIDTLEVGFVGGQANPVLLIQDMPLYGNNFTQDTISYKVRHEYGGAVVDYRGFYLGNN